MRKERKKGCCLFTLIKSFVIVLFVLAIFALVFGNSSSNTTTKSSTTSDTSETSVTSMHDPSITPTAVPTAEPATREEWVLAAAKEVYDDELISVEWQEVDNQKDMIVIWCDFVDNFTNQMRRDGFMLRAKNMLKRISQLGKDNLIEYGSCYIVARTTYLDEYNNEFEGNAMELRLLEKDLSKLNWDNYMNNETIINLATTYAVHPLFRD